MRSRTSRGEVLHVIGIRRVGRKRIYIKGSSRMSNQVGVGIGIMGVIGRGIRGSSRKRNKGSTVVGRGIRGVQKYEEK